MRMLCVELNKPNMLAAFFNKALFNGGEVNYLSILPKELGDKPVSEKIFHVFSAVDVVNVLSNHFEVINSKARNASQNDDQKVIFRLTANVGEIEVRTDSKVHHRQAKCRVNGPKILAILQKNLLADSSRKQLIMYGEAIKLIKD